MGKLTLLTLAASALAPAIAAQAASPPAGITWRNQAAAPPLAVDRGDRDPRVQRFVIRRGPDDVAEDSRDVLIRRDGMASPTHVIVRRERLDDMDDSDRHRTDEMGGHHDDMDSHHGLIGGHHGDDGLGEDEWIDEGREAMAYDDHADGHDRGFEEQVHYGSGDLASDYAQGSCCSGGMITETITTTTTYSPTVEERASYQHVAEHKPVRTFKRKLRRR